MGVPGEVLIGGAGVVSGYLHSEADAQRFLRDRFASLEFNQRGWTTLHRTGDLGRLTADWRSGTWGRTALLATLKIKLRGGWIDLREIESKIY